MENKSEGNENKIILGDFNSTIDKMDRNGGNKTQKLYIDVVQIMPRQNLSCIMGLKIYGEGRTQNSLSSIATIAPLAQGPGQTGGAILI